MAKELAVETYEKNKVRREEEEDSCQPLPPPTCGSHCCADTTKPLSPLPPYYHHHHYYYYYYYYYHYQQFYHPICRKMVAHDLGIIQPQEPKEGITEGEKKEGGKAVVGLFLAARKVVWTSMALWLVGGLTYAVISRWRGRRK